MRRSRISVKPNFRAGGRAGTESEQVSQRASHTWDTIPASEAEVGQPTPPQQQNVTLKENSDYVGIKDAPEIPSQVNLNDGAPSSGAATLSAAPHRRMRISATPKLVRPKLTSTPRTGPSARMSTSSVPSPLPNEKHVQIHASASDSQASFSQISNNHPESGPSRKSSSPTIYPAQSSTLTQSSSPCIPSTSGIQKSPARGKGSVEDCPPSPQPGQVPQQPPQEPESPECLPSSDQSSVCIQPSHCEKTGSSDITEKSSDKDRILRELKLKELMKIERRKDIQRMKRRVGHKEYTDLDRSKMTMRDLIYYLPNTSPMRSSEVCDENQAETVIPPSPKQHIKTAEEDEEEDDNEEEEENDEMLVPKVRVAEDGSIILDEESLTVRVQRTSKTKVVESSALFERGFTTTYSSFRELTHVKSWSVRETDLFFLAISMVGTDFSLMGQLLTHRSRAAIKNKFKKEERVNPWRVDKAFKNKRPYDKEFFSYLLEKVLAKDKDKRKSVKLILPKTKRKPKKSKVNHEESRDDGDISVEKENVSNVNEADTSVPVKKTRKRNLCKDDDGSSEEPVKRKRRRKCSRKKSDLQSVDDTEGESGINVEDDSINLNQEDEPERSTSASKRRHKRSKSDGQEQNEKPVKGTRGKRVKEISTMEEDVSAAKKKRKQSKNVDLNEPAKKNRKKKKALKTKEEETTEEQDASAACQEADLLSAPGTTEVTDDVPQKTSRRSKKPSPSLAATRCRKISKPETSVDAERASRDESIQIGAGSTLEDNRLQMKAVVVLEKTPPRMQHLLSPSKSQSENNELEPSLSTPDSPSSSKSSPTKQTRMQRAGKVRCNLYTSGKSRRKKGVMDKDEAESESPMVLLERITHETEHEDEDSLNENLLDLSCLHDFNSQSFQRRPMVVLSREEVEMVFDTSDQSANDDLSVSPLDLSLNTERSFPLQCSKIMEDIGKDAEDDCVLEEHEERAHGMAYHEEKIYEALELGESTLAQLDISNLSDISCSFNPEVCSQSEVGQSQVTTSCVMDEAEPRSQPEACEDAPVTQETVCIETSTLGTSLIVSDVAEESEKAILPCLLQEPELASSEITAQSNLTPTGSGLGSETSLKAISEGKEELLTSLEGHFLETLQGSSESNADAQVSVLASPEMEIKEDLQEEVSVQSSSLVSSEHGGRPTRRSRFPKPKPNLSQKSRVPVLQTQRQGLKTPGTLKPKTISTEEPLHSPATDQHVASEDFSKEDLTKQNETSRSDTVDQMESESAKDRSEASTEVQDQDNITTVPLIPACLDEVASEFSTSRCDVDMMPPCTSLPSPQPLQIRKDTGAGQMVVPSEDVCTAEETLHLNEDGHIDEEPTFILTLYEIPVTQAYLPSTSNDSVMTSDLPIVKTQSVVGFSDQPCTLPSTSVPPRIDSVPIECSGNEMKCKETSAASVTKDLAENDKLYKPILLDTKDEESYIPGNLETGVPLVDPDSEYKKRSDLAPFEYLTSRTRSTPFGFNIGKCIASLPHDSEVTDECERDPHMVPADVFVPVSEEKGDDSSKDRTMDTACTIEYKEASLASVAEDLVEDLNKQATSEEPIMLDTKDEERDVCRGLDTRTLHFECKNGAEITPLKDLGSRFSVSKCVEPSPQDLEQSEMPSHVVLADVLVETGDDSSKDRTHIACNLESKEASSASLPERQDTPYEELTKGEKSSAVSSPLLHRDSTEESTDTPLPSEEKKTPARRRARQIKPQPKLVKRGHGVGDTKTDQLIKEKSRPTSSHLILPAFHEEKLACISNASDEKSVGKMSSKRENKTSVSRGKKVKPKSIAEESPKTSHCGLESKLLCTALILPKELALKEENTENIIKDTITKEHMKSSTEDKELDNAGYVQACSQDILLMKTPGSDSNTMDSDETEAETRGVSHMMLPDVFILVSDEDDPSTKGTEPVERVSLTKESCAHFEKETKTKGVSQTLNEEPTRNQSPLEDSKTPVKKKGKQDTRTCTESDFRKTSLSLLTSPKVTPLSSSSSSQQLSSPPRNESMMPLEEKLQRRHHIVPCTVRLSSLDPVAQRLNSAQSGDGKSKDESTVTSSPTCRASVATSSEESRTSLFTEINLENPVLEKKSPERRKGKRNESSPRVKPVQSISQTRQRTITDWAKKKSHQTTANQEEKESVKSSQTHPYIKAKEVLEKPESSHLVPVLKKTEEVSRVSYEVKMPSEVAKESTEEPSVSQVKKSPARRRAILQVKPILSNRACTKTEGNTSTADEPQPSLFTSPTRQHSRTAREKEESDRKTRLPVKDVSNTSTMEADSKSTESYLITSGHQSPKSQSTWPRVVLPRVTLPMTRETGVCSDSSTPTSSSARVSESTSPPVTPPQKKSPALSCSSTADENPDDDPSCVSQFFLYDIFSEVEGAE